MPKFCTFICLMAISSCQQAELIIDDWKEMHGKSKARDAVNWDVLNPSGELEFMKLEKQVACRISKGMKLRSHAATPYLEEWTLDITFALVDGEGAGGLGFIDFGTGLYYYLYADGTENKVVLQRGDGLTSNEIFSHPFSPGSDPHRYALTVTLPENKQPTFTLTIDGESMTTDAGDAATVELGGTFQLYLGASENAVVDIYETTAIKAPRRQSGSWFWK